MIFFTRSIADAGRKVNLGKLGLEKHLFRGDSGREETFEGDSIADGCTSYVYQTKYIAMPTAKATAQRKNVMRINHFVFRMRKDLGISSFIESTI